MNQKSEHRCPICDKSLTIWNRTLFKKDGEYICRECYKKQLLGEKKTASPKQITETKCTCQACGNTWFYGKKDQFDQFMNSYDNCMKSLTACTCCLPLLFVPDKKVVDFDKCPKCNSKAITKETITHDV